MTSLATPKLKLIQSGPKGVEFGGREIGEDVGSRAAEEELLAEAADEIVFVEASRQVGARAAVQGRRAGLRSGVDGGGVGRDEEIRRRQPGRLVGRPGVGGVGRVGVVENDVSAHCHAGHRTRKEVLAIYTKAEVVVGDGDVAERARSHVAGVDDGRTADQVVAGHGHIAGCTVHSGDANAIVRIEDGVRVQCPVDEIIRDGHRRRAVVDRDRVRMQTGARVACSGEVVAGDEAPARHVDAVGWRVEKAIVGDGDRGLRRYPHAERRGDAFAVERAVGYGRVGSLVDLDGVVPGRGGEAAVLDRDIAGAHGNGRVAEVIAADGRAGLANRNHVGFGVVIQGAAGGGGDRRERLERGGRERIACRRVDPGELHSRIRIAKQLKFGARVHDRPFERRRYNAGVGARAQSAHTRGPA